MVMLVGMSAFACSRELKTSKVPEPVITAFNQRYTLARDVEWEKDDELYEVEFINEGKKKDVYFRGDGMLIEVKR